MNNKFSLNTIPWQPLFIIFLYIFYSFLFTFLNEPLLGFDYNTSADNLSSEYKRFQNFNSDYITSYSYIKDIINGVGVSKWAWGPLLHFLDVILAFLPTLLSPNVNFYFFFISPFQVLLFSLIISYIDNENVSLIKKVSTYTLCFLAIFVSLKFFDLIFSYTTGVKVYFSFFLEHSFHQIGLRSLTAILAISMYCYYYCFDKEKKTNLLFYLIFFVFSLSDIFFAVYFLFFLGVNFLFAINFKKFKLIFVLFAISLITILITYVLNSNLKIYIINIFETKDDALNYLDNKIYSFVIFLIPSLCFLYLSKKNLLSNNLKSLFFGSLLIHIFNIFVGLVKDPYTLRYSCAIIPVTVIYLKIVICDLKKDYLQRLLVLNVACVFSIFIFSFYNYKNNIFETYEDEIKCIKKIKNYKNYTLLSSYWPGKIIFEKLERTNNFIQVTNNLGVYHWIYNLNWMNINNTQFSRENYILLSEEINGSIIKKLSDQSFTTPACNNKIYLLNNITLRIHTKN